MKTILVSLSILLFVIVLPALCQTPQSSVETDIAVIKTEIKSLREAINTGFSNVAKRILTTFKRILTMFKRFLTDKITSSLPALVSLGRSSRSVQLLYGAS